MLENLLIGVASSLVASTLFIGLLYRLRPNIAISSEIARHTQSNGSYGYGFKFINRSIYPAIDVQVEIALYTPRAIANGQINDSEVLVNYKRFSVDAQNDPTEAYSNEFWVTYTGRLEQRWKDDSQYLVVRIIARHALSQFSSVRTQHFNRKETCVKDGQFANGSSLRVVTEG
jgi:hypothetical protein